jgi:hypothetical protein
MKDNAYIKWSEFPKHGEPNDDRRRDMQHQEHDPTDETTTKWLRAARVSRRFRITPEPQE